LLPGSKISAGVEKKKSGERQIDKAKSPPLKADLFGCLNRGRLQRGARSFKAKQKHIDKTKSPPFESEPVFIAV
jgi:hypothetical protein